MKKKLLTIIIITASAAIALAENSEYKVGHFYYQICENANEWLSTKGRYAKLIKTSDTDFGYTNEDVVIPSKIEIEGGTYDVRSVNMNSFNWMSNGQKLRLPSSIREIVRDFKQDEAKDESLFPKITITFPSDSIEYIGEYGFANIQPAYMSLDLFRSIKAVGANAFNNSGFIGVYLGNNLQHCASDAFHYNSPLSIEFSKNWDCEKEFESHCFNACAIDDLDFPEAKVLTIGEEVVTQCSALNYVSFPSMAAIHVNAKDKTNDGNTIYLLSGNPSLREIICKGVTPPEIIMNEESANVNVHITDNEDICILKVPEGYEQAYREHPVWGRFKTIVPNEETMSLKYVDNYVYEITKSASSWYKFDTAEAQLIRDNFNGEYPEGEIIIPSQITVNSISYPVGAVDIGTFNWMKSDQKLILPNSIKVISNYGLWEFEGDIDFPESVESLECDLFADFTIKTDLNLPNIKYITWRVFKNSNVEKLTLGSSIRLIGSYAFALSSLKDIDFEEGEQNELSLRDGSFWAVKNLRELKIPKRRKLHLSDGFITECDNLERVVFPDMGVIDCTVSACHDVAMLSRPYGELISSCEKLREVVCLGSVPPEITGIDDTATYNGHTGFWITDNMDVCVLKVPSGSEQAYREHPIWGRFKTIYGVENGDYDSIASVPAADDAEGEPVYYNMQGMQVKNPVKGQLYIRSIGSKTEKVVL